MFSRWGFKETIIALIVFMVFILLVSFLVSDLYSKLPESYREQNNIPSSANKYTNLENKIVEASKRYYNAYKRVLTEGSVITTKDLVEEGYLRAGDLLIDEEICDGYSIVEDKKVDKSYIRCDKYETRGD